MSDPRRLASGADGIPPAMERTHEEAVERRRALLEYLDDLERADPTPQSARRRAARRAHAIREEAGEHLDALIAAGEVRPPANSGQRKRPTTRVEAQGSISDLVADQRR